MISKSNYPVKLTRDFYNRDVLLVAEEILGKTLVHITKEGTAKGKIVEVEAYNGLCDKAAHSYPNLCSERTKVQYGQGGYAYVYLIYGMYHCMNIVTNLENLPEVLLLRALEPLEGIDLMKARRKTDKIKNLCSGPGKLCQAMGITRENYGEDLCGDNFYLEDAPVLMPEEIDRTKRINIDYAQEAKDFLWRFSIKGSPFASR